MRSEAKTLLDELLRSGANSIPVRVERMLPYESTDPEKPGMVHSIMVDGTLFVSREMYTALQREADKARAEDGGT